MRGWTRLKGGGASRRGAGVCAVLAGGLLPLGLAPFHLWPLALASAGGLFWVLRRAETSGRAFVLGWWFGVGKYGVGASWIYVSIHVHGPTPAPLATALVALFVAGLALVAGANGWLFARLRAVAGGPWLDVAHFAWAWVATEWTLTWLFTGFPWLFAGYAFIDTPLAGFAPVGGVFAVSFAAVSTAALALAVPGGRSWIARVGPLVAIAGIWAGGGLLGVVSWTQRAEGRTVALVQGDLPQETKWTAQGWGDALARYEQLSAPAWRSDIVFWPEAAIPAPHHYNAEHIDAMRAEAGGDLVLGAIVAQPSPQPGAQPGAPAGPDAGGAVYYNAALSTGGGVYRKRRLVPFGEYVPLARLLRGAIAFFDLPMSHMAAGEDPQPLLRAAGLPVGMAICYEVAYPRTVAEQARHAVLLATVSNDTWFGASIGPPQHLQIARMRALETGRFLVRATNNGITAIVDERGAVTARLPQFQAGVLTGEIRATTGATPFALAPISPAAIALLAWAAGALVVWLHRSTARRVLYNAVLRKRGWGRCPTIRFSLRSPCRRAIRTRWPTRFPMPCWTPCSSKTPNRGWLARRC